MRSFFICFILTYTVSTAQAQAPYNQRYFAENIASSGSCVLRDTAQWSSPKKATILALALPGAGQVYNKKYWKAGIVYAGAAGLIYMWKYNTDSLKKYQKIYISKIDLDTSTLDLAPNRSEASIKSDRDYHRRYRDVSILGFVALYALQAIDANVDAHLKEFKVNKDLSMKLSPELFSNNHGLGYYNGVTLTLKF
jgi:hypothetical protein